VTGKQTHGKGSTNLQPLSVEQGFINALEESKLRFRVGGRWEMLLGRLTLHISLTMAFSFSLRSSS